MLGVSTILAFCVVVLCIALAIRRKYGKTLKTPPGPYAWPIVGHIPYFMRRKKSYKHVSSLFFDMYKEYGEVYSLRLGGLNAIVLGGRRAIEEALVKQSDVFSNRPTHLWSVRSTTNNKGILFGNGQQWKELRRFTLTSLRDFGVGKKTSEEKILEELGVLIDAMANKKCAFDPSLILSRAVSNIISSVVFGDRFQYDSEDMDRLTTGIGKLISNGILFNKYNLFPWLEYFDFGLKLNVPKDIQDAQKDVSNFITEQIKQHKLSYDPDNPRDVIDLYIKKSTEEPESEIFTNTYNIQRVITELFLAGTETSSTTLRWALYFMLKYPEIQAKVREEITEVIGERNPTMADRTKLPFTEATLLEVQRVGSIAPQSVVHSAAKDTTLLGYDIPKDTLVFPLLYSSHYDSEAFPEPECFKPERWLNDKMEVVPNPAFMPFSIGKRQCLGEVMARMELFLFFVGLIQNLKFTSEDGTDPPPNIVSTSLGVRSPPQFKIQVERV